MSPRSLTPASPARSLAAPAFRRQGLIATAVTWLGRRQSRNRLALLDDRLLRDIGLDAGTAADEIAKPFWRD